MTTLIKNRTPYSTDIDDRDETGILDSKYPPLRPLPTLPPLVKGIEDSSSKSYYSSSKFTIPAVTMSGKLEIPSAYRRRSCPVFAPRSESGPCQRAEEEGRSYAGGLGEAAGKGTGTKEKVVHGLEKRVGFNHSAEAKCSVSGRSSGLTSSEVMKCLGLTGIDSTSSDYCEVGQKTQ